MRFNLPISSAKNYFLGFATSGLFLLGGLYYFGAEKPATAPEHFSEASFFGKTTLSAFNPNDLDDMAWRQLGFSEKQVKTILKYKKMLGGQFSSKEEIKKCFVISEEKYDAIAPYLLLPEIAPSTRSTANYSSYNSPRNSYASNSPSGYKTKQLQIPGKFNPDLYSEADFVRLGFSERQAASIVKYRNYLGGSFISKEKFRECYMISEDNYRKLAPYLLLPEKTVPTSTTVSSSGTRPKANFAVTTMDYFDPNTTDLNGWRTLGFSEKQAQVIINYRDRNLKGSFKSLDDIERCFVISAEKFQELKPFIVLNPATVSSPAGGNNTVTSTDHNTGLRKNDTDYSKVDLNEITFNQLVEFGFDERAAASFLGFRKKLGGFMNKTQILETYNLDKELAQKLINIAPLNSSEVERYTLVEAPEAWLKNHPYFKYYADKIIYFRITYPDDRKILRNINVKPDAEKRMRLYMK